MLLGAISDILLTTADLIALPAPIAIICAAAFGGSVVLLTFRNARRDHVSPVRAIGRSLTAGASWMLELM